MAGNVPLLVAIIAFGCVALIVFVMGRYVADQASMQRRLPIGTSASRPEAVSNDVIPNFFLASLTGKIDEKRFGIEGPIRTKLRRDLIRAGYFSDNAIRIYILCRLGAVVALPTVAFVLAQVFFTDFGYFKMLGLVAITGLLGVLGPDAYIARRQRLLQDQYRLVFPDVIDMLVVCIDAGLSLDGAFSRIQPEVSKQSYALGVNLVLLGAETRAGRSTADALGNLADRLNIDETRAFGVMLRQSLELGTDVGDALRVFSDELRGKRLLRAEETANKLPVKMVFPLGAFIFPVILMVIMVPVALKLISIANQMHH
jgi:tight adherence protein C